jgi:hypothetical protein
MVGRETSNFSASSCSEGKRSSALTSPLNIAVWRLSAICLAKLLVSNESYLITNCIPLIVVLKYAMQIFLH